MGALSYCGRRCSLLDHGLPDRTLWHSLDGLDMKTLTPNKFKTEHTGEGVGCPYASESEVRACGMATEGTLQFRTD